MACPDCNGRLATRTSRAEGLTYRQLMFQCVNVEGCGATFGGSMEITHRITPGVAPNPEVALRSSAPRRPGTTPPPIAANDSGGQEVPPAGNDNESEEADEAAG